MATVVEDDLRNLRLFLSLSSSPPLSLSPSLSVSFSLRLLSPSISLRSLRKSANPNIQDDQGYTLLHHAALNGQRLVSALHLTLSCFLPSPSSSFPLHCIYLQIHDYCLQGDGMSVATLWSIDHHSRLLRILPTAPCGMEGRPGDR